MIRKLFPALALILLLPLTARAAITNVDAPENVRTGTAFLVSVSTDSPEAVRVEWGKIKVDILPREVPGSAGNGAPVFTGQALLPVKLDATEETARLSLTQAGGNPLTRTIAVKSNTFETQELTVEGKYVHPPQAVLDQIERDRVTNSAALALKSPQQQWSLPFYRPVNGSVSSSFGLRRVFNGEPRAPHRGLDLRGAEGTPIRACADGVVVVAEEQYYSGNCVFVDHGMGVVTTYLHMSAIQVVIGQQVERGQVLGLVGSTGRVTGPHLHLGLSVLGTMVDPMPLLEVK